MNLEIFQHRDLIQKENKVSIEEELKEEIAKLQQKLKELKLKELEEKEPAVEKGKFEGVTIDRNDPGLKVILDNGMQQKYLVLSEEERAKGFVRPVRSAYRHAACGTTTHMGRALSETYARNPKFYGGTYCVNCGTHFPLQRWNEGLGKFEPDFYWDEDGTPVGE